MLKSPMSSTMASRSAMAADHLDPVETFTSKVRDALNGVIGHPPCGTHLRLCTLLAEEGKETVEARHLAVLGGVNAPIVSRWRNSTTFHRLEPFVRIADAIGYETILNHDPTVTPESLIGRLRHEASAWRSANDLNLTDLARVSGIAVFTVYEWMHRDAEKPIRMLTPFIDTLRVIDMGIGLADRR